MLEPIDFKNATAPQQFVSSLKESGFAVLENHPILVEKFNQLYQAWQQFFESKDKYNYPFDKALQAGYLPAEEAETAKYTDVRDLKEMFHFYYYRNRCPEQLHDLTEAMYFKLRDLAGSLLGWLQDYSPAEVTAKFSETLPSAFSGSKNHCYRVLYYPALPEEYPPEAKRAAEHEDINLITVLPASNQAGLQIKLKNGEWLDVPYGHNYIVINAGDMLQEMTDHYYPSTTHRVLNPVGEAAKQPRISTPLFCHPREEVVLSDKHTAASYLHERLTEQGLLA